MSGDWNRVHHFFFHFFFVNTSRLVGYYLVVVRHEYFFRITPNTCRYMQLPGRLRWPLAWLRHAVNKNKVEALTRDTSLTQPHTATT